MKSINCRFRFYERSCLFSQGTLIFLPQNVWVRACVALKMLKQICHSLFVVTVKKKNITCRGNISLQLPDPACLAPRELPGTSASLVLKVQVLDYEDVQPKAGKAQKHLPYLCKKETDRYPRRNSRKKEIC